MRSSLIVALLSVAGHGLATTTMLVCNENNCLRAVQASAFPTRHGSADCASYFLTTVTPATMTLTATATAYKPTSAVDDVGATTTSDVAIVNTLDITASTTVIVDITSTAPAGTTTIPVKRDNVLAVRQLTVVPSSIPTYASACSGSIGYSSACSCVGASMSISTAPTPSTTVTTTVTSATIITTVTTTTATVEVVTTDITSIFTTTDATATVIETAVSVVIPPPVATYYAECGPSNLIDTYDGQTIDSFQVVEGNYNIQPYTSAYDCCVSCILTPGCGISASSAVSGECFFLPEGSTCSPTNELGTFSTSSSLPAGDGFTIALNAPCGMFEYT